MPYKIKFIIFVTLFDKGIFILIYRLKYRIMSTGISKQALWERKLLDFSMRNNLLNTKPGRRVIQFVSFDIHLLEDEIQKGCDFSVTSFIDKKSVLTDEPIQDSSVYQDQYKEQVQRAMGQKQLIAYLNDTELEPALKNIFRTSRTAMEENGTGSLFLAFGMLKWFEKNKTDKARYAPLLLVPVNLVRKGGSLGYVIRYRQEETILNTTLTEFLKQNYGINLDFLMPLPVDAEGADTEQILAKIAQAVSVIEGWEVKKEAVIGLFSFNKFVMWNDIHSNSDKLRENAVVNSLTENRIKWSETGEFTDARTVDKTVSPENYAVVLDADSSQLEAVIESAKGKSFVLHGPPGTGKSQTIANIIANALYQGKRVLFVAEKMAALSVVQKRLEKIGIGNFCLELHSNKVTKTHFLSQMQKALDALHKEEPEDYKQTALSLFEKRKELIQYAETMHDTSLYGMSLYDMINGYLAIEEKETQITVMPSENITKDTVKAWQNEISSLVTIDAVNEGIYSSPLKGLMPVDDNKDTLENIKDNIKQYIDTEDKYKMLLIAMDMYPCLDLKAFDDKVLEELSDNLALYNEKAKQIQNKNAVIGFFAKLSYNKSLKQYAVLHCESLDLLKQKCRLWLDGYDKIHDWWHWVNKKHEYLSSCFIQALNLIEQKNLTPQTAVNSFIKALYRKLIGDIVARTPQLRSFNGLMFDELIEKYKQQTAYFTELTRKELYCKLASNVPSQTMEAVASSEMGILKRNIANKGRGITIRGLIDKIPALLPKLCPCMLMSPLSVAQYIDLNGRKFDLVIFDEASQMPTCEAVGAIARGKSLIVVGDPMQMPPTNFFNTNQTEEEEAQQDDLESILDDCISLSVPSHYLSWHYRSKHESLIAFSNYHYYDNRLFTFPSTDDRQAKVRWVHIDGVYDKAKTRSNLYEARAIVDEIVRRLKDKELSEYSIGVVAFSKAQQNLIEDLLNETLAGCHELEEKAYNGTEPVLVKNLENVQGDERDVILFSVGYGADKEGKVSMNFGPLNNVGGERRLNVAVSRARYETVVYSVLTPEQIDLKRTDSKGVQGLKMFLEFARSGKQTAVLTEKQDNEKNTVINQIAYHLQMQGYQTQTNVGRSGFKIDLAVCDKNKDDEYILGILCDGKVYYNTKTVRDREIVQRGALERLGWNVMRVWSLDWYNDKEKVLKNIFDKLNNSCKEATKEKLHIEALKAEDVVFKEQKNVSVLQNKFSVNQNTKSNIKDIPSEDIEKTVIYVLEQQISLPEEDLKKTTARMLGFARTGVNIDKAISGVIKQMSVKGIINVEKDKVILNNTQMLS